MSRLVLRNARVAGRPGQHHLVLSGGSISAVCDDHDLPDVAPPGAQHLDLAGRVVTPGLTDSHFHPVMGVGLTRGTDLSHCRDLPQLRAALHAAAASTADEWVLGWGLDPNCFGDAAVNDAPIADTCGDRPVFLRLFDGHSALVSPQALHRAGITGPRDFASRSQIVCDAHGNPTGLLLEEEAMAPVMNVIPQPAFGERRAELKALLDAMAATGLCGGHAMDCNGDTPELFASLDEAGELPLRVRIAPWRRPGDDADRVAELLNQQGRGGRLWQISGAKLFMDGTIDNGTAWLEEPDCHGASTDSYWRDPHDYTRAVHHLAEHHVQTATHAIGDAAVAHVLTTVAKLPTGAIGGHRIEHIETLPDRLVPAFRELGVVASMQPTHATNYTRADHTDNWSRRLGTERANRAWRCRDLHDAGALLTLGSDWPIAPFDPRAILADAQLRRPWDQPQLDPVAPTQALTAAQALAGYTTGPAAAAGDKQLGHVAPGYRADLTIWDDNPLDQPPDQLPHLAIALTIVDGQIRHRNPDFG